MLGGACDDTRHNVRVGVCCAAPGTRARGALYVAHSATGADVKRAVADANSVHEDDVYVYVGTDCVLDDVRLDSFPARAEKTHATLGSHVRVLHPTLVTGTLAATCDTTLEDLAQYMYGRFGVPADKQVWVHDRTGARLARGVRLADAGVRFSDVLVFATDAHDMVRVAFAYGTPVHTQRAPDALVLRLTDTVTVADAAAHVQDCTGIPVAHQTWFNANCAAPLEIVAAHLEGEDAPAPAEASRTLRSLGVICCDSLCVTIAEPWPLRVLCPDEDIVADVLVKNHNTLRDVKACLGARVARHTVLGADARLHVDDASTLLRCGVMRGHTITLRAPAARDPFIALQCSTAPAVYTTLAYDEDATTLADMHTAVYEISGIPPECQLFSDATGARCTPFEVRGLARAPADIVLSTLCVRPRQVFYFSERVRA